jgi:hypothetical protein
MSLQDAMQTLADALEPLTGEIPELQILPRWTGNPTPPCIDIYPAPSDFQQAAGAGVASKRAWFVVRARASITDEQAANDLLLALLDPAGPASVEQALYTAGAVIDNDRGAVNGFTVYADSPEMLGCDWTIGVFV